MASNAPKETAGGHKMDRRIIRVENMPDQAGIAASLRRAFAAGAPAKDDAELMFEELLKQLH